MRRPIIATIVLLLAAIPVVAQHGGGHASAGGGHFSGGHAGFSGGHTGGFSSRGISGPRMSSSPRFSSGIRAGLHGFSRIPPSRSNYSRGPLSRTRGPIIRNRNVRNRNRGFAFSRNCIGFPCRRYYSYPWAYGGLYDPYWWWDQSSYDDDYERDRALASEMNQQSLDEQQMRHEEEAAGDQDAYLSTRPAAKPSSAPDAGASIIPSTVLVFRDRHQQEVQNYAIVGQTLWSFTPQRIEKIPLTNLDLTATTKANDDRGVSFALPIGSSVQ